MKKTDGFSLIELVVGILASALVSGAIITFLLMGMDTSNATFDANADQRNAKIVISMMEKLASEGTITKVSSVGSGSSPDWTIFTNSGDDQNPDTAILSYIASSNSIRTKDGAVLMDGILSSSVKVNTNTLPGTGCLLEFSLETAAGKYETAVFCRPKAIVKNETSISATTDETQITVSVNGDDTSRQTSTTKARLAFLSTLLNQLGSTGMILDGDRNPTSELYSIWYYNVKPNLTGNWGAGTPWCACFVSWAMDARTDDLKWVPIEANVDMLFLRFLSQTTDENAFIIAAKSAKGNVLPGDLIFFDWDHNSTSVDNPDLEHVGVVLFIEDDYVYTIEGNSGNQVALRRYALDDPSIFRYGRLDWDS